MFSNLIGVLQRTPIYAEGIFRSVGSTLGRVPSVMLSLGAEIADFFVVQVSALAANSVLQHGSGMTVIGILGANAVGFTCYFSFRRSGLYELSVMHEEMRVLKAIALRWSVLCLLLALSAMALHHSGDRGRSLIAVFYVVGLMGFGAERLILARITGNWFDRGNYIHSVGIIGGGDVANKIARFIRNSSMGVKLSGLFDSPLSTESMRVRCIENILDLARKDEIDTVIIADQDMKADALHRVVQQLKQQPLSIYLVPGQMDLEGSGGRWHEDNILPGLNLYRIADRPINEMSLFVKSALDRLAALLLVIIFAPVMLLCAVGIRLSGSGPILFRQMRIGYKGREFQIFKFRTMYVTKQQNYKLTERNDPRVFWFGTLLRKTSLDELPQLFNVIKGDMSLVGPRPHMPQATAAGQLYFDAVGDYAARHRVRPGITGWAQVNGWRGPTETVEQIKSRVAHDLYYIEHWSISFDIFILLKTFLVLFGKDVF